MSSADDTPAPAPAPELEESAPLVLLTRDEVPVVVPPALRLASAVWLQGAEAGAGAEAEVALEPLAS